MSLLLLAVSGLCIWDYVHTNHVFNIMQTQSNNIFQAVQTTPITDEKLKQEIKHLNDFWTKKMDTLSVSISRKDLQPVSDYLQYLYASTINENQEDSITYSRLLNYNLMGLKETNVLSFVNLL